MVLGREGIVKHDDLPFMGWPNQERPEITETGLALQEMEKEHISKVLRLYEGRKTETAQALGIDRKTLREKIKKYDLE